MIFHLNGKRYKLQGVQSGRISGAAFQSMNAEPSAPTQEPPSPLQSLLQKFSFVFQEPTTLPPFRAHYHTIPLLPNVTPSNLRPYRYPYQ